MSKIVACRKLPRSSPGSGRGARAASVLAPSLAAYIENFSQAGSIKRGRRPGGGGAVRVMRSRPGQRAAAGLGIQPRKCYTEPIAMRRIAKPGAPSHQATRRLLRRFPRVRFLPVRSVATHRAGSPRADSRQIGDLRETRDSNALFTVREKGRRGDRRGEPEATGWRAA